MPSNMSTAPIDASNTPPAASSSTQGPTTPALQPPSMENSRPSPVITTYLPLLGLTISPLLALLPPRKLDLYTFTLGAVCVISAEELYYGRGIEIMARRQAMMRKRTASGQILEYDPQNSNASPTVLQESSASEDVMERLRARKAKIESEEHTIGVIEHLNKKNEEVDTKGVSGMMRKLWYGDEKPGWQQRRFEEERERLEAGESLWDIVSGRVKEAFGGKDEDEDDGNE